MITRFMRQRLVWLTLVASIIVAALITFFYLGAFLSPADNTHKLPLGIVNADAGTQGAQIVANLTRSGAPDTYQWTVLRSRDVAVSDLKDNTYDAVIVIPTDYSARLAAFAQPGAATQQPIQIEVLTNSSAGTFAASQAQAAATTVVSTISKTVSAGLVQRMTAAKLSLPPTLAVVIADPVQAQLVPIVPVGNHSARGLSAFYFALMLSLTTFVGTNIVGMAFDVDAEKRRQLGQRQSAFSIFAAKALFYTLMAVGIALSVTLMAVALLGMDTPNALSLTLFAILASVAVGALSLLFQTVFGRAGLLVGLFVFTILGVPASGGPYALQMIPDLWRILSAWVPLRYMTDGTRALLYLDSNADAGLAQAIAVLVGYALLGYALAATTSYLRDRSSRKSAVHPAVSSSVGEVATS